MQIIALAILSFIFGVMFVAVHLLFKHLRWLKKVLISLAGTIGIIFLIFYIYSPKSINYSDPELTPLWKAVEAIDRASIGFTPVLKDSSISIEKSSGRDYDVMLHISNHTSRTIAFKKKGDIYYWIGEQEIFKGPQKYNTPDGNFSEEICLTYYIEGSGSGPLNVLNILYSGEDSRLRDQRNLTLMEIRPILKEWKY